MTPLQDLTVEQLRKLVAIREQIETLQGEIDLIAGGESPSPTAPLKRRGRRKKSRSQAARVAVAARWDKVRAKKASEDERRRQGENGSRREGALGQSQSGREE